MHLFCNQILGWKDDVIQALDGDSLDLGSYFGFAAGTFYDLGEKKNHLPGMKETQDLQAQISLKLSRASPPQFLQKILAFIFLCFFPHLHSQNEWHDPFSPRFRDLQRCMHFPRQARITRKWKLSFRTPAWLGKDLKSAKVKPTYPSLDG